MPTVLVPFSVFDCLFLPPASHFVPLYTGLISEFSGVTRAGFQKACFSGSCLGHLHSGCVPGTIHRGSAIVPHLFLWLWPPGICRGWQRLKMPRQGAGRTWLCDG